MIKQVPNIMVCDFETLVCETLKHKEYMVSITNSDFTKTFTGYDCVYQMFQFIKSLDILTIQLYAHNAGFDFSFLLPYLSINKDSLCFKDGQFYKCEGYIPNSKIKLVVFDSLKMLQMKLSEIPEFLGLKVEKEVFDYSLNTAENFETQFISYDLIKDLKIRQMMKDKAIEFGADMGDNTFDYHLYSKMYCEMDVTVLYQGLIRCDQIMTQAFGASIFNYLTISSYADDYMKRNGVYDGVKQLGGICRNFIQKTIVGGCVRLKNNM